MVKRLARAVSRSNSSIRGHCAPGSGVRGALLVVGLSSDAKAESQPKWSSASSWTMLTSAHLHWFRRLRIRWKVRDDIHEAFLTRLVRDMGCEPVAGGGLDSAGLLEATAALFIGLWVAEQADVRAIAPPLAYATGPRAESA